MYKKKGLTWILHKAVKGESKMAVEFSRRPLLSLLLSLWLSIFNLNSGCNWLEGPTGWNIIGRLRYATWITVRRFPSSSYNTFFFFLFLLQCRDFPRVTLWIFFLFTSHFLHQDGTNCGCSVPLRLCSYIPDCPVNGFRKKPMMPTLLVAFLTHGGQGRSWFSLAVPDLRSGQDESRTLLFFFFFIPFAACCLDEECALCQATRERNGACFAHTVVTAKTEKGDATLSV